MRCGEDVDDVDEGVEAHNSGGDDDEGRDDWEPSVDKGGGGKRERTTTVERGYLCT
jgi:hypothetical protein